MVGEFQLRREGRQVAQLRFTEREKFFELELVLVISAHRGRGLGTALIRRLLVLADAADKPVYATARPIGSNSPQALERLTRYYERLRFSVVERGVSSVRMKREPRGAAPEGPP